MLNDIELRIKRKIEELGIQLKDWDIQINYGIKTGFNEAFIITSDKRNELIKNCPNADKIIRPILRGRDIQRYKVNWQKLYLIATHNGYIESKRNHVPPVQIDNYPEIKKHLKKYWTQIRIRQDKGITPYHLRSCIYMEDFFKQKIIYPNMTKYLPFYYDTEGYYTNQKCFIVTGENIAFLTAFFNSSLFKFCFKENFPELQGGTRELSKVFFDKIPVIQVNKQQNEIFASKILEIQKLKAVDKETIIIEKEIDQLIFNLYELTNKERKVIGFIEII